MSTIKLNFSNGNSIHALAGCKVRDVIENCSEDSSSIIGMRVNNRICPLSHDLNNSAYLEPVCIGSSDASDIYRRSLCFILAAAAYELYPEKRLIVGHSLGYGYYYVFDNEKSISKETISALSQKMQESINKDESIKQSYLNYNEAIELFEKLSLSETRKQFNYICPPQIKINTIGSYSDMYISALVPSTRFLKHFELLQYKEGFLLRFPKTSEPEKIPPFNDIPELFNVYKKYKDWGKQIGVTSAASLNELVFERKVPNFIDICETLQNKCIADVASMIATRETVKIVLIAGPSSSGKTTTSKKLGLQLRALGYTPHLISLDNYYVGREDTPKDKNGEFDYECLEALDVEKLNEDLVNLFNGKKIPIPSYNFVKGERFYTGTEMELSEHDILILEGIHGLNEKLTPLIKKDHKFKIYLSALTQLNLDDHNRIPTSDNRLVRRIVRDSNFRGKSAADTIKMWPSVHRGERLHIFPFQNNADIMLNTALDYELAVLKVYAEPLLRCVSPLQREYAEACRLLSFLSNFPGIPAQRVPSHSIIREFIGGSAFKY